MSRSLRARWACLLALAAAGCQDYNFNPVGRCLIQPGTKRVTLSNLSSADVLFVVDDSGSMGGEQAKLGENFDLFISNLDASNAARAAAGLQPFDFHIAVTTTSVFWNFQTGSTCSSSCQGAAGQLVCCTSSGTPARHPKRCASDADCAGGAAPTTCGTNCSGFKGESYCCNQADGTFPTGAVTETVPCSRADTACGTLETHYDFGSCDAGVAVDQWPFPGGDFVSWTSGSTANPRVLHFDKELYTGSANKQGFTRAQLLDFFRGGTNVQGNVIVGTCGSGEEQALQAARLALEKAVAGQQKDTYARAGTGSPAVPQQTWTPATRTAGSAADFLAQGTTSKLVLVFVGDEDDCSSPKDPSSGVVMLAEPAGADACTRDATTAAPVGQKELSVESFVDYFTGLGRPVGAAFIFPAAQESCSGDACTAGLCCASDCPGTLGVCTNNSTCGAQAPGNRLLAAAGQLRTKGSDVVLGSICDSNFGMLLESIAELVKPPTGLELPSEPAADEVTLLRIASENGATRKLCGAPLAPASFPTLADAQATGADWWFTAGKNALNDWNPVATSQFVYINPSGTCIANPGETYSADYLGRLPSGGCWDDPTMARLGHESFGDAMCRSVLGGAADSWTCYTSATTGGACEAVPDAGRPGTCICGARADNCTP